MIFYLLSYELNSFIHSNSFYVDFLRSSICSIMLFVNTLLFKIRISFFLKHFYFISLTRISSTVLNSSHGSKHLCLFPALRGRYSVILH